jgi:hypothetical protein
MRVYKKIKEAVNRVSVHFSAYFNKDSFFQFFIFLLPLFVIAIVFRKVIFFPAIFAHLDVLGNYLPYLDSFFKTGSSIQTSFISGFPIHLSISTTWYSPFSILARYFFDAFDAFRYMDVFFVVGAYVGTYFLCRKLSLSHISAIVAGLIYVFSGQVMLWSETIIISAHYMLLPLVLLCLSFVFSSFGIRRILYAVLAALVLGVSWLVGHVQWAIYIHLIAGAYILYSTLKEDVLMKEKIIKLSVTLLLVFGISYIIGHPMISAIRDYAPYTGRSGGVVLSMAYAYAYYPYHFIHYLLPSFSVPYFSFFGQAFQNYIGILPLILFLFGLASVKKVLSFSRNATFFLIAGLFCLIASLKYSPIIFLFHYLPFLNSIREAPRIMFVGDFAIAIYIAFVLDYISANKNQVATQMSRLALYTKRTLFFVVGPIVTIATIVYIFFFTKIETILQTYFLSHMMKNTVGNFGTEYYFKVIHGYLVQAIGQFSVTDWNIFVLLFGLVSAYWIFSRAGFVDKQWWKTAVLCIVSFNFLFQYYNYINVVSRKDYYSLPNTVSFIKERESAMKGDLFRVFSPLNGISLYTESVRCNFPIMGHWEVSKEDFMLRKELFEPNVTLLYGIDNADGYEPYVWSRTDDVLGYIGSRFSGPDRFGMQFAGNNTSAEEKIKEFAVRKNMLRSLNIKYIASYYTINDPDFTEVFAEKVGVCRTPIYLYELSNMWPRYFTSDSVSYLLGKNDRETFIEFTDRVKNDAQPKIYLDTAGVVGDEKLLSNKDGLIRGGVCDEYYTGLVWERFTAV